MKSANPSVNIWVPKIRFPKMHIFRAPIESTGSVWYLLNSLKALACSGAPLGAPAFRGIDKDYNAHIFICKQTFVGNV